MFSWKMVCEYIPFIVFFLTYKMSDMFFAVSVKLTVVVICLTISYFIDYQLSLPLLFSSIIIIIFGVLTLFFKDTSFVMMQPTILYVLMAFASIFSSFFKLYITKYLLKDLVDLSVSAHRFLSYGLGIMLFKLAFLNEIIRLYCSESQWVNYKIILFPPVTLLLLLLLCLFAYSYVFTPQDINNIFNIDKRNTNIIDDKDSEN